MSEDRERDRRPLPGSIDDEVAFHLQMRTRELIEEGMDPADARVEALRRFGDIGVVTSAARHQDRAARSRIRRRDLLGEVAQDVRIGLRRMLQAPGFSTVAVLIIALGVGANAAIFSVLNTVVLQPLPYPESDRLVEVWESSPSRGWDRFSVSQLNYRDFRDHSDAFKSLAAVDFRTYDGADMSTLVDGEAIRLAGRWISVQFFDTFGIYPILGRAFSPAEDEVGNESRIVLLGERFWRDRLGADVGVVNDKIVLNDEPYVVLGVMPAGSFYFDDADVYLPLRPGTNDSRSDHRLDVFGRLKPGVTMQQAEADLDAIAAQLAADYPDSNDGWDTTTLSLYDTLVPVDLRTAMYVLIAAGGTVLLIACANLSSLLVARATSRHRELAIYSALGASRGRIVRQMLIETTLLALAGGAVGTALAVRGVGWFRVLDPGRLPRFDSLAIDPRVLLYALGATALTAVLAGLLPAWQSSRYEPVEALKGGGRGMSSGARARRLRQALLVAEIALAIVLLAGASLLIRSLLRVQAVDPGLDPGPVLTAAINMPFATEQEYDRLPGLYRQMLANIEALPGVRAAATISGLPFGGGATSMDIQVVGRDHDGNYPAAFWRLASPHYFDVMGIPLLKGRTFYDVEEDARHVAIISESMADALWPGEDPIGKRFQGWRDPDREKTVVGVVGDVRERDLETRARNMVYMPHLQMVWWSSMYIVARTDGDPVRFAGSVREAVRAVVPDRPVTDIRPLADVLADTLGPRRFNTMLLLCFAAVALVLAAAGVYGVMTYVVAQRRPEIGIRVAMGARANDVAAMVIRQGMAVVGLGAAIGLVAAVGTSRFLASMLFGVTPFDLWSLAGTTVFLTLIALLACALPAVRAARVDPTVILREM